MEILSFTISGKMAHFRKYYANNTAFSFSIPPRTTLMGIVAAAMGWPKDSYYEDLASENIQFAIRVLNPLKKSFHRLNFLSIKSTGDMAKNWSSDFRGEGGRIQTPFEVITAWDLAKGDVAYQVFIKASDKGKGVYESIKSHFLEKEPVYNITLGTANFTGRLTDIEIFSEANVRTVDSKVYVLMNSAVPVDLVEDLKFDKEEFENYNFVEEDMLPGDYVANGNREVCKMNRLLFSITPHPLRVKLRGSYFVLKSNTSELNIQFMDA
ncbi:CRISPR-associated protein Cas5h [Arenibacter nanhaiticus]|uniref:CRISPR-associated protein Cas5h n=1 Tax=Arenibacter nanhaiticus TaxID=558155 RepID=A0A1M6JXV5_9FLAO|nr:CRISPR-associated protein Cas5 [Arenibacter nanhaiticus]SHJ51461.1 CRISPR-associated protein Cas5h [Arenibacter nanhaiticus]